jgi:hypothetical protein
MYRLGTQRRGLRKVGSMGNETLVTFHISREEKAKNNRDKTKERERGSG